MGLRHDDPGVPDRPLSVWVVSDGRAGIEAQALGVAEAVARRTPARIEVKHVRWRAALRRLPTRAILLPQLARDPSSDAFAPPWPDLLIGNGRATTPFAIALRRWSGGRAFVVQLQDPMRPPRLFDLVVPPRHDQVGGEGVFPITGSPHRVTRALLDAAAAASPELASLPRPRVALLVGGRSRAFDLTSARAEEIGRQVAQAAVAAGGSVMATVSRRTPPDAEAVLRRELAAVPGFVWDGAGKNPYFAMLAVADHVVVTQDSVNMITEAASTGAPVHIAATRGGQARKDRFYAELAALGVARPFTGALDAWTYMPLDETARVADEILRRMAGRASAARRQRARH